MIKKLVDQLTLLFDSGKFLKTPFQWVYVVTGALCFLPALAFIVCLIIFWDKLIGLIGGTFWNDFVSVFIFILFFYTLLIYAFVGWRYWMNRKVNLDAVVKTGSRVVAIPLVADFNQCKGEMNSIFLVLVPALACVLAYIAGLLTNGFGFYTAYGFAWWPFAAAAGIAVLAILAYLNILITRYVSERIRLIPQISNDVRHIATSNEKADRREADNEHVHFAMPEFTNCEKKGALWAIAGAAVVAFIITACLSLGNMLAMQKSIYKELSESRVEKIANKKAGFAPFYSETRSICLTAAQDKYQEITYNRLFNYQRDYYDNFLFKTQIRQQAYETYGSTILDPYQDRIEALKKRWSEFIEQYDPNLYLPIHAVTGYYNDSLKGEYNYPDFYFQSFMPRCEVIDAIITYVPKSNGGRTANGAPANTITLSELHYHCDKAHGRYYTIDDPTFWDNYHMNIQVLSVTLLDGTVISRDLNMVPGCLWEYLKDPCEDTKLTLIREMIDHTCPTREEYINTCIKQALLDKDPLCYELITRRR